MMPSDHSLQILIDGYDLELIDLRYWRRNISVVSQEPVLFSNATIFDNIAMSLPGIFPLKNVLKLGNIDPEGYR